MNGAPATIDDTWLDRHCHVNADTMSTLDASRLALDLAGLAVWWLKPAVLQRAAADPAIPASVARRWQHPPALPVQRGACWPTVVSRIASSPLREAFVMPLRWVAGGEDDPQLPASLLDLAGQMRATLDEHQALPQLASPAMGWCLRPAIGDVPNFAGLTSFRWDSAWAPLAAGLITAAHGASPNPAIWASGAWRDGRVSPVDSLPAKLRLAAEHNARHFFLPADQLDGAPRIDDLELAPLRTDTASPAEALAAYVTRLDVPPAASASQEDRRRYYRSLRDPAAARRYFCDCCLPEIAAEQRSHLLAELHGCRPTHLVTVASDSPELVRLVAEVLEPRRCLLLHTADYVDQARGVVEICGGRDIDFAQVRVDVEDATTLGGQLHEAVAAFGPADAAALVLDLTPGRKDISLTLALEAAPPGSHLLYCAHRVDGNSRRPVPFTQQMRLYPAPARPTPTARDGEHLAGAKTTGADR